MIAALALAALLAPEPAATPAPSGYIRVANPVLYYEVAGPKGPDEAAGKGAPVVLIHGGQMDRRMWDPQFESWSKTYRVVRYDVRGYGRSATPTVPYSDVDDLLAVLDSLSIPKAHLVGLSLGGRIAIDFALVHPDRVASLVVAAPGLSGFPFEPGNFMETLGAAQERGGEAAAELWLKDPYMVPAMEHADLAQKIRALVLDNARTWLENPFLQRRLRPPAAGRLAEIHAPMLILIGDRDVPDMQKVADKLAAEVKGATRVVIPGAGHISNLEKPAEFDRAALAFLAAHSAAR
jgi:pimeloyl-ACP methyl ester carboxylesterase